MVTGWYASTKNKIPAIKAIIPNIVAETETIFSSTSPVSISQTANSNVLNDMVKAPV